MLNNGMPRRVAGNRLFSLFLTIAQDAACVAHWDNIPSVLLTTLSVYMTLQFTTRRVLLVHIWRTFDLGLNVILGSRCTCAFS